MDVSLGMPSSTVVPDGIPPSAGALVDRAGPFEDRPDAKTIEPGIAMMAFVNLDAGHGVAFAGDALGMPGDHFVENVVLVDRDRAQPPAGAAEVLAVRVHADRVAREGAERPDAGPGPGASGR